MALYESNGTAILVTMYDIVRYFDSESAFDCYSELYKSKIQGKIYRLMFNLNKSSTIRIITPVGVSQPAVTQPLVTQGSIDAAVCSAVNLDSGMCEFFCDKDNNEVDVETKEKDRKRKKEQGQIHGTSVVDGW